MFKDRTGAATMRTSAARAAVEQQATVMCVVHRGTSHWVDVCAAYDFQRNCLAIYSILCFEACCAGAVAQQPPLHTASLPTCAIVATAVVHNQRAQTYLPRCLHEHYDSNPCTAKNLRWNVELDKVLQQLCIARAVTAVCNASSVDSHSWPSVISCAATKSTSTLTYITSRQRFRTMLNSTLPVFGLLNAPSEPSTPCCSKRRQAMASLASESALQLGLLSRQRCSAVSKCRSALCTNVCKQLPRAP